MIKKTYFFFLLVLISCEKPTHFSQQSLQEKFINFSQKEQTFESILTKHKGKKILIDVWASWCKDCLEGLPDLIKLQNEAPEVVYVFLSLDKTVPRWKMAIERYQIMGDHYFVTQGNHGAFAKFINLWWIPRYMVVDETGEIILFKATKITDKNIINALKK